LRGKLGKGKKETPTRYDLEGSGRRGNRPCESPALLRRGGEGGGKPYNAALTNDRAATGEEVTLGERQKRGKEENGD